MSTTGRVLLAAAVGAGATAGYRRLRDLEDRRRAAAAPPVSGRPRPVTVPDGTVLRTWTAGDPDAGIGVVLVHGWSLAARFWDAQLPELARRATTVCYDQRGHGRSPAGATTEWSFGVLATDLDAVIEACLPRDVPLVVVGHSMGAMAVIRWAAEGSPATERLAGAVLCNTAVHGIVPGLTTGMPDRGRISGPLLAAGLASTAPMPAGPRPVVDAVTAFLVAGQDPPVGAVRATAEMTTACDRRARAGLGRALLALDLRDAVGALTVPTLVVAGGRDRLTPPHHSRRLTARLPAGRIVELPRAGHHTPQVRPVRVTGLLLEHLEGAVGGATGAAVG